MALPEELRSRFEDGETAIWVGHPSSRLYALDRLGFLAATMSLTFFILSAAMTYTAASEQRPWLFAPGGLFGLAGVYLAIGRAVLDSYLRQNTLYALTNKRAFILCRAFGMTVKDLEITPRTDVEIRKRRETTVFIGSQPSFSENGALSFYVPSTTIGFVFRAVPDHAALVDALRKLRGRS